VLKTRKTNSQINKQQESNKLSRTENKPVHSARKFSDVLGATSGKSSKTIVSAGSPSIYTSIKTCGFFFFAMF
jgi:hypothetical protein